MDNLPSHHALYELGRRRSAVDILRLAVGVITRLALWAAVMVIVGDAAVALWGRHQQVEAIGAVVLFPITVFVWPWVHHTFGQPLWIVGVTAMIAYPISTFVGGLPPIERPGDF